MSDEDMLSAPDPDEIGEGDPATIGDALSGDVRKGAVMDVNIDVVAVLGTAELVVSQILQLGRGAVVELERTISEPVELKCENQVVARGEVVMIEDKLGIQLTDVIRRG
ncbi:MAG: FliM/FliN family flagellar motor switch protein [Rhodospirillales bacterium]|nr:FliM/FliN family flagellar motor switch protein [Rhodospirillales bacterium]